MQICNFMLFTGFALLDTGCFNGLFRVGRYAQHGEAGAITVYDIGNYRIGWVYVL